MLQGEKVSSLPTASRKSVEDQLNLIEDFYNNITWRQLHALLTLRPIKASPEKVADLFQISLEEAVDAVEGLYDLGLLSKNGDTYTAAQTQFMIPDNLQTRETRVTAHVNQSRQILNMVSEEKNCSGWTTYIGASYEDMEWFRLEYRKLVEKLESKADHSIVDSLKPRIKE